MQTFLPYKSFTKTARCLDTPRLSRQVGQVLHVLQCISEGEWRCSTCANRFRDEYAVSPCCKAKLEVAAWAHNPVTLMWTGYELALVRYGLALCKELMTRANRYRRGRHKVDVYTQALKERAKEFAPTTEGWHLPTWLGKKKLHSSHRAALLRKDGLHYGQFGWRETPLRKDHMGRYQYWWPIKVTPPKHRPNRQSRVQL